MIINLFFAWCWILAGFLTGLVHGLFFHDDNWLGGYGSWRRRIMRLGHVAFFGTGFINIFAAITVKLWPPPADRPFQSAISTLLIVDDEELLVLMRDAGCMEVLIGLESPVDAGLSRLELRANWKQKRFPQYREAIQRIQSHGIRVNGCFILGLDGHGLGIFDAVYRFAEQTALFDVQITYPTPFPGTAMYQSLKAQNRLLFDRDWRRMTLFDITFQPTPLSVGELGRGFRDLGLRLYSDEFTRFRREAFKSNYLHHRKSSASFGERVVKP